MRNRHLYLFFENKGTAVAVSFSPRFVLRRETFRLRWINVECAYYYVSRTADHINGDRRRIGVVNPMGISYDRNKPWDFSFLQILLLPPPLERVHQNELKRENVRAFHSSPGKATRSSAGRTYSRTSSAPSWNIRYFMVGGGRGCKN